MYHFPKGRWTFDNISWGLSGITIRITRLVASDQEERVFWDNLTSWSFGGTHLLVDWAGKGYFSSSVIYSQIQWEYELKSSLSTGKKKWLPSGEMEHHPKPTTQVIIPVALLRSSVLFGQVTFWTSVQTVGNSCWSRGAGQCHLELLCSSRSMLELYDVSAAASRRGLRSGMEPDNSSVHAQVGFVPTGSTFKFGFNLTTNFLATWWIPDEHVSPHRNF